MVVDIQLQSDCHNEHIEGIILTPIGLNKGFMRETFVIPYIVNHNVALTLDKHLKIELGEYRKHKLYYLGPIEVEGIENDNFKTSYTHKELLDEFQDLFEEWKEKRSNG